MSRLINPQGEEIRQNVDLLSYAPGVELVQTPAAGQAIGTATFTAVSFTGGTKVRDTDGVADLVLQPTRLTAKIAGRYRVYGVVGWNPASAQYSRLKLYKNGADLSRHVGGATSVAGGYANEEIVAEVDLAVGDYVELYVFFSTAGSTIPAETWFGMSLIGNNIVLPVRFKPAVWQAASGATFPSGPFARYDVLEYAMANPDGGTVLWEFVYRDDLDATRPWHFKGGPPATHTIDTNQATSSGTAAFANLPTSGPQFTLPRSMVVSAELQAVFNEAGAASRVTYMGVANGDTNPARQVGAYMTSTVNRIPGIVNDTITGVAADVVKARYNPNGNVANWELRRLLITPVRMA